jgi:DNA-binding CsgD family transcriptional regulator
MTEMQQYVLKRLWFDGKTQNEVANELGVSRRTIRSTWDDIRKKIYSDLCYLCN